MPLYKDTFKELKFRLQATTCTHFGVLKMYRTHHMKGRVGDASASGFCCICGRDAAGHGSKVKTDRTRNFAEDSLQ